jgi:hypothetical protein
MEKIETGSDRAPKASPVPTLVQQGSALAGLSALSRWSHTPEEILNKLRDELLNAEVFDTVLEAKGLYQKKWRWQRSSRQVTCAFSSLYLLHN